jgi:tetrahydromethanopterin S-methyltransferase subunit B
MTKEKEVAVEEAVDRAAEKAAEKAAENAVEEPEAAAVTAPWPDYSHVSAVELEEVEDLRNQIDQHARSLKALTDTDGSFPERDDIYAFNYVESAYLIEFGLHGWRKARNMDRIDRIFRDAIDLAKLFIVCYHVRLCYTVEDGIDFIGDLKDQITKAEEKLKARPTDTFSAEFIAVAEELQLRINRVDFLERLDARILGEEYNVVGYGELSNAYALAEEYFEMHMARELEVLIKEKRGGVSVQDKNS